MRPDPTRVLIVDAHALVRAGARAVLASEPGLEVVGEAATAAQARDAARQLRPDLVLLGARLPDQDGAETCRQLRALTPRPAVLILGDATDQVLVHTCLGAGATGYLLEDVSADDLRRGLRALARGDQVLDHRIAPLLASGRPDAARPPERLLSVRRRAILRLLAEGLSNREIAERTNLSELTVKGYVEEILAALGARNRVQAAVLAIRRGLI